MPERDESPVSTVTLDTQDTIHRSVLQAATRQGLPLGGPIDLAAHDGRWLRFAK